MTPRPAQVGKAYFIGDPPGPVRVTAEPVDKIGVALDRLLGTRVEQIERACEADIFSDRHQTKLWIDHRHHAAVHRDFTSLRASSFLEMYEAVTGEREPYRRVLEAQVAADWANVLGAALGRRLLTAYAAAQFGEESIMRPASAASLRDQRAVAIAGAPDVGSVDPESADYTELPKLADREMPFSMLQKGVIVTLSRRVIVNNDVDVVTRLIDELGRAARRTLARAVWAPWIANSNYGPDSTAWFHANHSNLQTTAISEAEVIAGIRKLLDQTQPGNNEKMGVRVRPGSLWLNVPTALWDAAMKLNQTTGSALYHLFGEENEFIIVNPLLTDANDFGVHRDAREVESIRVSFLNGREDPEFFVADTPNADQMMAGDRLAYKLRAEYGVGLAEFRGAVKAVVP